jgi:predicted alpha/beta hydrolase
MAANAIDDLWAMPRSRDAFMSGYPEGTWQGIDINPADFGLKSIGHMGYFRRQALPLWRNVLDWLEEAPKA